MNNEERQRQMDFLLQQQARHDHELAQIRRILLSAIRIGRRDRTDFREKFNVLIKLQIKSEEEVAAFRIESRENIAAIQAATRRFQVQTEQFQAQTQQFQAQTQQFQAETRQTFSKSVAETIDRVDEFEDSQDKGGRPTN